MPSRQDRPRLTCSWTEKMTRPSTRSPRSGAPIDQACAAAYDNGPYAGYAAKIKTAFDGIVPQDADPAAVAREVVRIVGLPKG